MTEPKDVYPPKPHIAEGAHIGSMEEFQRLYGQSLDEPEAFWAKHPDARR